MVIYGYCKLDENQFVRYCPNPLNNVANPTAEMILAAGYKEYRDVTPEPVEGGIWRKNGKGEDKGEYIQAVYEWVEDRKPTYADYDAAMEAHLKAERDARGYTLREPTDYTNSSVARFAQDAADWCAHRDAVMLYGLDIVNKAAAGEPVPTLDEFKAGLPQIQWTLEAVEE